MGGWILASASSRPRPRGAISSQDRTRRAQVPHFCTISASPMFSHLLRSKCVRFSLRAPACGKGRQIYLQGPDVVLSTKGRSTMASVVQLTDGV